MKRFLRAQLREILRILATLTIRKYRPFIVGVTGSVGKTSAKEAIYAVLRAVRQTRANPGNLNNEFGFPLTILGDWQQAGGAFFWCRVILRGVRGLLVRMAYPEALVLEYAADKPGDLKMLLEIARPSIGVVTAVGDIPAHIEFYPDREAVAREKASLIEVLPAEGCAILNGDDGAVRDMRMKTRARTIMFGFGEDTELRITNFEHRMEDGRPAGITCKFSYGGSFVPIRLTGCFGKPQAYAAAAAAGVGIACGMNLLKIAEALNYYAPPRHRMTILPGIKETLILDDAYNASPASMRAALETLAALPAARRVGVLGDMLEIGEYTVRAHEEIGRVAGQTLDLLVTVGPRAKFIASAAADAGLSRKQIQDFETADEARLAVQDLIRKGDLILIKASRAVQLEAVVEEIRRV